MVMSFIRALTISVTGVIGEHEKLGLITGWGLFDGWVCVCVGGGYQPGVYVSFKTFF